ncbi:PAS domain S-box protein [Salinibacter ruber]|uniref:PAS domain S-box protein n=1 Tax=Salinibacter ruber TaxID=146919 RepID=UPI002342D353|nr:PAS domain S-box protein [Salinibacter ruber]MCS4152571.1 PAS domain S-box-containing protein [Salinibacter ruber]
MTAYFGYLLAFVVATAACLGAAWRARSIPSPETRQALTWFFSGSAVWAGAYVGFLLVGSALEKHLFYQLSLIVGFGTVFAWLWFCSAYSGRGLHRNRRVQQFAIAVFAVVTALKVTNPLHGLYYGLEPAGGGPTGGAFGLVVTHETLYWVVMAVAYALSAAGYLMIFEFLLEAEAKVLPLGVLTGLTALPAALNVVGHVEPALLDITHEPLGVAVFAVGLLFAYETQFSVVQLTGSVEEPNLTIGREGRIRGLGGGIEETVPPLSEEDLGRPLTEALPGLGETIQGEAPTQAPTQDRVPVQDEVPTRDREEAHTRAGKASYGDMLLQNGEPGQGEMPRQGEMPVWEAKVGGETRYYRVIRTGQVVPTSLEGEGETRTVILSDITGRKREERRRKQVISRVTDGIVEVDSDWRFTLVNEQAEEIYGMAEEEMLGRSAWEVFGDLEGTEFEEIYRGVMRSREPAEIEARYEGLSEWFDVQVYPSEDGGLAFYFKVITGRKEREEALRRAKRRYQTLIENFPDGGAYLFDENLQYVLAGGEKISIVGDPEEVIGTTAHDILPEELAREQERYYRRALEGKRDDFEQEYKGRRYRVQTLPVRDGDGTVISGITFSQDITEQRRRKKELERKNDLFRRAQEIASVGAWEYDAQSEVLRLTDRAHRILGFSLDDDVSLGRSYENCHPEDRCKAEKAFSQAVETGEAYDIELRIQAEGGEVRWVRCRGEPQNRSADGEVARLRGSLQDITDQKRREKTLRRLREKYQGLLQGAPDAIFVASAESGRIVEANQAAASLLGAPAEEIAGRHQSELHPSGEAEKYRSLFETATEEAEAEGMSFRHLEDGSQIYVETDSGEKVPVEISATTVDLSGGQEGPGGGEPSGREPNGGGPNDGGQEITKKKTGKVFVGIFRDITERKRRTERLKEAKKQAELSKLEAEEASRMKSAMLANMSHEIRTPLTGVIGFAEAIGEETRGEETEDGDTGGKDAEGEGKVARFAGLIEDSGRRLLDTLDAVLNLSKLEAGKMSLQPEPVDLAGQARQVAREFEEEAAESGLTLEVQTEEAWARADEGGLKIVLQNLLSNAIKYTEEGGVTVRTYREDEQSQENEQVQEDGQAVVLEVEDSGIGMDPSVAERLFEPFRQASEGMSREYEGTGIGLAVTKRAAEEMGGSIEVDTQKGEGSRFTVRFPAARSAGSAEGPDDGGPDGADRHATGRPETDR